MDQLAFDLSRDQIKGLIRALGNSLDRITEGHADTVAVESTAADAHGRKLFFVATIDAGLSEMLRLEVTRRKKVLAALQSAPMARLIREIDGTLQSKNRALFHFLIAAAGSDAAKHILEHAMRFSGCYPGDMCPMCSTAVPSPPLDRTVDEYLGSLDDSAAEDLT